MSLREKVLSQRTVEEYLESIGALEEQVVQGSVLGAFHLRGAEGGPVLASFLPERGGTAGVAGGSAAVPVQDHERP